MFLNKVTITGADESVSIEDLLKLSQKFPFVEWGILFSEKNQGNKERYPSWDWIGKLLYNHNENLNLSAHICGKYCKDILLGKQSIPSNISMWFKRIQLNFNSTNCDYNEKEFIKVLERDFQNKEVIFQLRRNESDNLFWSLSKYFHNSSIKLVGLYDKSGGTGKAITDYPKFTSLFNSYFGYAGGINPDNIEDIIKSIQKLEGYEQFWIDMESGIRREVISCGTNPYVLETIVNDVFDLEKVEKCLQIASKYIQ